jgi:hypothetical protein
MHILGAIELDDPIHLGEVQTPRGHVGGEEGSKSFLREREVECHALGLLLPSMQLEYGCADLQLPECLIDETDLIIYVIYMYSTSLQLEKKTRIFSLMWDLMKEKRTSIFSFAFVIM